MVTVYRVNDKEFTNYDKALEYEQELSRIEKEKEEKNAKKKNAVHKVEQYVDAINRITETEKLNLVFTTKENKLHVLEALTKKQNNKTKENESSKESTGFFVEVDRNNILKMIDEMFTFD